MAEADLESVDGQAEENPISEPVFGMGEDESGTSSQAPEVEEGHPENAKTTSTDDTPDPVETERGYLRQQDYTRKTEELAQERRDFQAEREAFRTEMAQLRQQMQQTQQAPVQQQNGLVGQLQQVMNDPNLSPEDRAGLNVIRGLAEEVEAYEQELSELRQIRDQFQQTSQVVQGLTQQQQQAQLNMVRNQMDEARQMFGEDVVQGAMGAIRRLGVENGQWNPETNPSTGKPYTISEIVAMATGRTAEDRKAAVEANRNGRVQAKHRVAANGSQSGNPPKSFLTPAEAMAEIEANQVAAGF